MKVIERLLDELAQVGPKKFVKLCPPEMLIDALAHVTGYDADYLSHILEEMERDAQAAAEPLDIDLFVGVTLERDW